MGYEEGAERERLRRERLREMEGERETEQDYTGEVHIGVRKCKLYVDAFFSDGTSYGVDHRRKA